MSGPVAIVGVLFAAIPLIRATLANRRTALIHALAWLWAAWLAWAYAALSPSWGRCYLAAALTGCAGIAVLGARRPGVAAWHFVVAGLFVVLMLPAAEGTVLGTTAHLDTPRIIFVTVLFGTCVVNYLPTWLFAAATCVAIGLLLVLAYDQSLGLWWIAAAPWTAWAGLWTRTKDRPPAATWRDFRDRFGAIWALRVREQFNAAAKNAGLACELGWSGFRGLTADNTTAANDLLAALIRRFGL